MARKDFIISWFASSPMLKGMLDQMEMPYVLFSPQVSGRKYKEFVVDKGGNSILGLWNMAKSAGDEIGRVAVLGFSEGCQGVRACLETKDATGIDAVIPCDGIHTDKIGPALEMSRLGAYISFAALASAQPPSDNRAPKLMVVTHSGIGEASLGPGKASTTETAEVIYSEALKRGPGHYEDAGCGWPCPAALHEDHLSAVKWPSSSLPVGTNVGGGVITPQGWSTVRPSAAETNFLPSATFTWWGLGDGWTIRRAANNLFVYGWTYPTKNKTKDPTGNRDHVFQAQMVLPYVAREVLVQRWNPTCGPVAGFGDDARVCVMGGKGYGEQVLKPLDNPFPMGVPIPKLPDQCPTPPPGRIIVGKPGDPCWSVGPEPAPSSGDASSTLLKVGAFGAAAAVGWYAANRLQKRR